MTATYLKARPTTYKGIEMRSRLEARFASVLDAVGIEWTYEPRAYRASAGEYLPDFQVGPRTFVEVKPDLGPGGEYPTLHKAIAVLTEAMPGAWLWIVFSNGTAGAVGPLGNLSGDDYPVSGHAYVCVGCKRVSFRVTYAPAPFCHCGDVLSDIEEWLTSTGPAPA